MVIAMCRDPRKAIELAYQELEEYRRTREPLRLRDACEKAWLAIAMATDELLARSGFKKPESYRERRELLRELEKKRPIVAELGLRDKFAARGYYLHILGYHEGALSEDEVVEELEKAKRYIGDIEKLIAKQQQSKPPNK